MKKLLVTAAMMSAMAAGGAHAESTPIMFSTLGGFNAPTANEVGGLRVSLLYGQVDKVTGLDLSILGMSETQELKGVNWSWLGANRVKSKMTGASLGFFNWHQGDDLGANLAFVNITNNVKGLNWSAVNYASGETMVDLGLVSISEASLVQVGIFNMTSTINAVQVGLINCASNGFLPCFPIVNFSVD